MIDYTPGTAKAAGTVVVVGGVSGLTNVVVHVDIAAGELAAAAAGGGVYDMVCAGAYALGAKVYWDDAAKKVTSVNTNGVFGYMAEGSAAGGSAVAKVIHDPRV
jgi:predicted RecA/RadA family phage recombinase